MQELTSNEYYRVLPLIKQVEYDIVFARAVIEKIQSGRIFVDDRINPTVTLISHYCGMALLCGNDANENFNKHLTDMLFKKASNGPKNLRMAVYPGRWKQRLEKLLGNRLVYYSEMETDKNLNCVERAAKLDYLSQYHIIGWTRVNFKFDRQLFERDLISNVIIPDGFVIKRIDEGIAERISGRIVPSQFWDTNDDFIHDGLGYCLLYGDTIVSTSFSAFIANNQIDIGIETNPGYRGKGFGFLTGAAMIKYCLINGYEPIWGCRKDNQASYRLAQKLGFEERICHPSYWSIK